MLMNLGIDNLKTVAVYLSKLSNEVDKDVVKKTEYNKLVTKVNAIKTSGFLLKTQCSTKITEIEDKISSITALASTTALNAVENKIPNLNDLVKKDYNGKISNTEKKYFIIIINLRVKYLMKDKRKLVS